MIKFSLGDNGGKRRTGSALTQPMTGVHFSRLNQGQRVPLEIRRHVRGSPACRPRRLLMWRLQSDDVRSGLNRQWAGLYKRLSLAAALKREVQLPSSPGLVFPRCFIASSSASGTSRYTLDTSQKSAFHVFVVPWPTLSFLPYDLRVTLTPADRDSDPSPQWAELYIITQSALCAISASGSPTVTLQFSASNRSVLYRLDTYHTRYASNRRNLRIVTRLPPVTLEPQIGTLQTAHEVVMNQLLMFSEGRKVADIHISIFNLDTTPGTTLASMIATL
ncbi:hypothetical protein NM688_g7311 [Phlebia brevispora]|uniref:Uncharacterized protein n=1 Tax=Phlebia brevispora TaxID=194682 RepID=A0ACC1S6W9_9APHY|nr:hypothetical protein NM688_g7311 [Phlebia brevispora]